MNEQPKTSRVPCDAEDHVDLIIVDVLEKVSAKIRAGEMVDFAAVVAEHPECSERLRKLLPTVEVLASLSDGEAEVRASSNRGPGEAVDLATPLPIAGMLGDYRIVREVGRGGMGIVYEAEQLSLKRRVALKVLPFASVLDQRQLQRFRNEAQAAAALRHPHIVQVFAIGCERGVHYYAMDYIEGQTVAEAISDLAEPEHARDPTSINSSTTQMPESASGRTADSAWNVISSAASCRAPEFLRTVAKLGVQAAEALEHAHRLGIVHRDIKPSNLLLDAQGQLFVTDFGLAMTSTDSNLTMSGDVLGTVRYMSPEQVQAKHQVMDHRADIYSLGITLYEMLTLRPAFTSTVRQTLMQQVVEDDPPKPRQINPAVPRDVETIVLKAIAKEPNSRYATAEEFANDLQRFLTDVPIWARRPSLVERSRKWAKRHRAIVRSMLLLLAVGATVLLGLTRAQYRRRMAITQHLAAASALADTADYSAAENELAEASARMESLFLPTPHIASRVASLSRNLTAKTSAQERFVEFQRLRQLVHANVYTPDPQAVRNTDTYCRQSLALYRALESTDLRGQPAFEHLSLANQQQLREAVAELLFILSVSEIENAQGGPAVASAHLAAIDALRRIDRLYRPLPAVQLWLAVSLESLGDSETAQAARLLGEERAADALDDFIRGEYQFYHEHDAITSLDEYSRALVRRPDHYLSLLAAGLTLRRLQRSDAAQAMLTGAIAANPDSLVARMRRAGTYISQRKYELAEMDLDEAKRLAPYDYDLSLVRAWCLESQGDLPGAMSLLTQAEQRSDAPTSLVYQQLGSIYSRLHNYEEALRAYSRAITVAQSRPEATMMWQRPYGHQPPNDVFIQLYTLRGLTHRSLGHHNEAAADFGKALTFSPVSELGYENLGIAHSALGDHEAAVEAYLKAIQNPSEEIVEYAWLAHAYRFLGEWDKAIACFGKQLEISPDQSIYFHFRASAHLQNGDVESALLDIEKAIELKPEIAPYHVLRARIQREMSQHERARADIDRSIQLDPTYTIAFCYRALLHAEAGKLQAAQEDLARTVDVHYVSPIHSMLDTVNTNQVAWFLVTCPDPQLRDPDRALQIAQTLVLRKSNQRRFWTTLGVALYRTGDLVAARKHLEKMVAIRHGRRGHAALFLAMTCHELGDRQQARRWYEQGRQWITTRNGILKENHHLCTEAAQLIHADAADDEANRPLDGPRDRLHGEDATNG